MSYDVSLTIDTGGVDLLHIGDLNVTYNVSPMFREALGGTGLRSLHGKPAKDCIRALRTGIADIQDRRKSYYAMNSKNGWGDVDTALEFMANALDLCLAHPKATFHVG